MPTPPFPRPRLVRPSEHHYRDLFLAPHDRNALKGRGSRSAGILFPRSTALTENSDFEGKQTVVLRSVADNWMDLDADLEKRSETADIRNLAIAINGTVDDQE